MQHQYMCAGLTHLSCAAACPALPSGAGSPGLGTGCPGCRAQRSDPGGRPPACDDVDGQINMVARWRSARQRVHWACLYVGDRPGWGRLGPAGAKKG